MDTKRFFYGRKEALIISLLGLGIAASFFLYDQKFPLPVFYELPFLPVLNWWSYLITLIILIVLVSIGISNYLSGNLPLFFCLLMVEENLNIAIEIVRQKEVLKDDISFEKWLEIFTDCINSSKTVLRFLQKSYNSMIYIYEKTAITIIFFAYVVYQIEPTQCGVSASGICLVFGLFLFVLLNERILNKVKSFPIEDLKHYFEYFSLKCWKMRCMRLTGTSRSQKRGRKL